MNKETFIQNLPQPLKDKMLWKTSIDPICPLDNEVLYFPSNPTKGLHCNICCKYSVYNNYIWIKLEFINIMINIDHISLYDWKKGSNTTIEINLTTDLYNPKEHNQSLKEVLEKIYLYKLLS